MTYFNFKRRVLVIILVIGLFVSVPSFGIAATGEEIIRDLQAQIAALQAEIVQLQQQQDGSGFQIGDRVQTTDRVKVRRTAAGMVLGVQASGASGTVIEGPTIAGRHTWWNINYDSGADGWSAKGFLTNVSIPTPPPPSSITVLSPNGGEQWQQGTKQVILWRNILPAVDCPVGLNCTQLVPTPVSINLTTYIPPCTGSSFDTCPLEPVRSFQIAISTSDDGEFEWRVGDWQNLTGSSQNTQIPDDQYIIQVSNGFQTGVSAAPFSIVSQATGNLPPTISSVTGPTALKIGETGKWEIKASDPENGSLSYTVFWGDESVKPMPLPTSLSSAPVQQTTTFTHSYANAGLYTPIFYVADNQGLSAKTSISVSVGTVTARGSLYLSPSSLSVSVGQSAEIQAFYQPPVPPCLSNLICAMMLPASYPVSVQWASSNSSIAEITQQPGPGCAVSSDPSITSSCAPDITMINGVSAGTAEIKAYYSPYPNLYTAKATVEVRPASTQPSITVLSPNGGEQWQKGSTQTIKWQPYRSGFLMPTLALVTITLKSPPIQCFAAPCLLIPEFSIVIANNISDSGQFSWTVGNNINGVDIPNGNYVVQVSNGSQSDSSDAPFSIVAPTFDFSLTNDGDKSVAQGGQATGTLNVTLNSGVSQKVYFGVREMPAEFGYALPDPSECLPSCSFPYSIIVVDPIPTGVYAVNFVASGGGITKITPVKFAVIAQSPSITVLSPTSGSVGTNITITGTGFTSTGNMVLFGSGAIPDLASSDGKTITFALPSSLNPACYYSDPRCLMPTFSLSAGTYQVSVKNANGQSNQMTFTVTESSTTVSNKFQIGDRIKTTVNVNVRATPSLSNFAGPVLGTQAVGTLGIISASPLNLATYPANVGGYLWWYVNFDSGADGWVAENYIEKIFAQPTITVLAPNSSQTASVIEAMQVALLEISRILDSLR